MDYTKRQKWVDIKMLEKFEKDNENTNAVTLRLALF